jgi:phosphoglycolate phosphatase
MTSVLWDLDGTLVDSAGDIAGAVDRMLAATGRTPLGEARVRSFIGDGAKRLVDQCVSAAGGTPTPDDLTQFLVEYHAFPVVKTRIFDGIADVLAAVRVPQAVVTNKPESLTRIILERLGIAGHFRVVIGGDTLPVRKPDPAPVRVALERLGVTTGVLIGDGPADVGAAAAAGIAMIGVGWGIARPVGAPSLVETPGALNRELRERGLAG